MRRRAESAVPTPGLPPRWMDPAEDGGVEDGEGDRWRSAARVFFFGLYPRTDLTRTLQGPKPWRVGCSSRVEWPAA